jgi:hypothetical protein
MKQRLLRILTPTLLKRELAERLNEISSNVSFMLAVMEEE